MDGLEDPEREMRFLTCVSLSSFSHSVACVELVDSLVSVTS